MASDLILINSIINFFGITDFIDEVVFQVCNHLAPDPQWLCACLWCGVPLTPSPWRSFKRGREGGREGGEGIDSWFVSFSCSGKRKKILSPPLAAAGSLRTPSQWQLAIKQFIPLLNCNQLCFEWSFATCSHIGSGCLGGPFIRSKVLVPKPIIINQ